MTKDPLHVYLNDHLAGATAGVDLVTTAAENHEGDMGEFFQELADGIRTTLERIKGTVESAG